MHKDVICLSCGHLVRVILFRMSGLTRRDNHGWVFGLCPICEDIAYIKRGE